MADRVVAHGPGRVNLIGEHTDYNAGLCLPFAIARGVTVTAERRDGEAISAISEGAEPFLRAAAHELRAAGVELPGAEIEVASDLPIGVGLSSSAALSAALVLALLALAGADEPDRRELVRLCARIENDWIGARTGMLDQTAVLMAPRDGALLIDFHDFSMQAVPIDLAGWRLAVLHSGATHDHSATGYNDRRAECERACAELGITSLREAVPTDASRLEPPLARRLRHVLSENARVREMVAALALGDLDAVGALLDASHASLRDDYDVSVPAVERTRARVLAAGATGARIMGGGFGGSVLALFAPGVALPADALAVEPGRPAALLKP